MLDFLWRNARAVNAASAVFDPVVGEYRAEARLDVVQLDHTVVDVVVVDEITRQAIDRPILTPAIDVCTRAVTGFYLALVYPSTLRPAFVFLSRSWRKTPG